MRYRTTLLNGVSALALLAGASLYVSPAAALTITFDDLTDTSNGNGGTQILNGYQGLNWSNWYVLNGPDYNSTYGPNGVGNDTDATPNLAFNRFGTAADFTDPTGTFTLDSAAFTAFWNGGGPSSAADLQVTMIGKLNGTTEDEVTFGANTNGPITETFNWSGINEVYLNSSGGSSAGYGSSGTQVAMNNLTITPVPAPLIGRGLPVVLAVGGVLLGAKLSQRSKKRRSPGSVIPHAAA
jgi:hypothetical protein